METKDVKTNGPHTDSEKEINLKAKLIETQAILKAAMDCSQAGIAIADAPSGKLRYVNKAGLMIRGKSEAEIVKNIDAENYVPSWKLKNLDGTHMDPDEVPLARAVLYGESCSREFLVERGDGEDRTVIANAEPILDENGKIKAAIVVFLDVSELRQTKELLSQQYHILKGLIDSYQSPIFSVDTNYCYTAFNESHSSLMKALYGVDIETGKSILDYQSVDEDRKKAKANIDQALSGKTLIEEAWSGDEAYSKMYFEVSHSPVKNQKGDIIGVAVIVKELTDRKKFEAELKNKIDELARFNKMMIGREQRMKELKTEINQLCRELKIPEKYI